MRLLFVENHATLARVVIGEFLAGYDVTVTPSLAGAYRPLEAQTFDVVLVDYDLDDGKGADLVRALRARGARAPVIAASSKQEANEELMRAGADAVCGELQFSRIASVLAWSDPTIR